MSNVGKKDGVSRREFLKHAGTTIGGITLVSLGVAASCSGAADPPDDTTIAKPPNSSDTSTASNTNTTSKPPGTGTISGSFNIPEPELMPIPDCDARVALDRKYSPYHIWVYPMPDNIAYIGATESFHKMVYIIKFSLADTGTVLSAMREDSFGYVEGSKINSDLTAPVSGTVIEKNPYCEIEKLYTNGWMLKIQMSNPDELNRLYTPQYYAYLESPSWSGPIPPMH